MLTTWEYSVKSEAERLVMTAHQIVVGFYKTNNFIILPYNSNSINASVVTFPDLPYNNIPRFWKIVKTINVDNLPLTIDQKLTNGVEKLIEENKLKKTNFGKTKELWGKVETEVINEIYKVIPSKANLINKIIIYSTVFGTNCSFSWINENGEIYIYLREDQGICAITEAIITSLTRRDVYEKLEGVWAESEIITDYLVTETSIGQVLQKYEKAEEYLPTLKGIRGKEQAKLRQESDEFYKKLGISIDKRQFNVNDFNNLTDTEKNLLTILIKNENQVVDMDKIGESIFKNEDDFSLYAISKTVQRLRDKFEANGISGSYIQTLRGKGYVLKN